MSSYQTASDNTHIEFVSSCGKALIVPTPNMKIPDIIDKIRNQIITASLENRMLKFLISRHSLKLELEQKVNIEFSERENEKMTTHFTSHNKLASLVMPPNLICLDCDEDFEKCKHPIVKIMREISQSNQK
jgi:hypothetical protein